MSKHPLLRDAEKMISDNLVRRKLKSLAKRSGLSESLLRKINNGTRKMNFRTAEILLHGHFDQAKFEKDLSVAMTLKYDADGTPHLINDL